MSSKVDDFIESWCKDNAIQPTNEGINGQIEWRDLDDLKQRLNPIFEQAQRCDLLENFMGKISKTALRELHDECWRWRTIYFWAQFTMTALLQQGDPIAVITKKWMRAEVNIKRFKKAIELHQLGRPGDRVCDVLYQTDSE